MAAILSRPQCVIKGFADTDSIRTAVSSHLTANTFPEVHLSTAM